MNSKKIFLRLNELREFFRIFFNLSTKIFIDLKLFFVFFFKKSLLYEFEA